MALKPTRDPTMPTCSDLYAPGVDDFKLVQTTGQFSAFNDVEHRLFEDPAPHEVVRIADKVKRQTRIAGWLDLVAARTLVESWKEQTRAQAKNSRNANSDKIVISLFDHTGNWSRPWEEAGYQVLRFDIQDDPVLGDVNAFDVEFFADYFGDFSGLQVYAILAACPCTEFAISGARHFSVKDADGRTLRAVQLVQQTLRTIEYYRPVVWAVENPVGRIEKLGGLPSWRLAFNPNHFGDPYTKKTLIWGRFNADLPIAPVEAVEGSKMHTRFGGRSMATKNARSETPEGFAYGFFLANNANDHPVLAIANKYDRLDARLIRTAIDCGLTSGRIDEIVSDAYYFDLDDHAAEQALRDATAAVLA